MIGYRCISYWIHFDGGAQCSDAIFMVILDGSHKLVWKRLRATIRHNVPNEVESMQRAREEGLPFIAGLKHGSPFLWEKHTRPVERLDLPDVRPFKPEVSSHGIRQLVFCLGIPLSGAIVFYKKPTVRSRVTLEILTQEEMDDILSQV